MPTGSDRLDDEHAHALRRQWQRIADAADHIDPGEPSRIGGWRNAEVLAHLAVQPVLLARFLTTAGEHPPTMRLADNLAGTHTLAGTIDQAAPEGAAAGRRDFARHAAAVDPELADADLQTTVTTLQGVIRLADYLRTRCLEAVVHGADLQPPVEPDPIALAATSLLTLLHEHPTELATARAMGDAEIVEVATGRAPAPATLTHVMPLMS